MQGPSAIQHPGGWQNEFLAQQQQSQPMETRLLQTNSHMNHPYQPSFAPGFSMYNNSAGAFQTPQQTHPGPMAATEKFNEAAFDAAFEQAHADLQHQQPVNTEPEYAEPQHVEPAHMHPMTAPTEHLAHPPYSDESMDNVEVRIGSDNIPQTDNQTFQNSTHEADALAQTAGELLDSVRHEQNDKFQQSTFLALMRRIRDREVEVKGDEFREVSSNP